MLAESVHRSHFKERLTFEVSINRSEVLSLIEQISERTKDLMSLSDALISVVQVTEENSGPPLIESGGPDNPN